MHRSESLFIRSLDRRAAESTSAVRCVPVDACAHDEKFIMCGGGHRAGIAELGVGNSVTRIAEVDVKIFGLHTPPRSKHPLRTAAGGPACARVRRFGGAPGGTPAATLCCGWGCDYRLAAGLSPFGNGVSYVRSRRLFCSACKARRM